MQLIKFSFSFLIAGKRHHIALCEIKKNRESPQKKIHIFLTNLTSLFERSHTAWIPWNWAVSRKKKQNKRQTWRPHRKTKLFPKSSNSSWSISSISGGDNIEQSCQTRRELSVTHQPLQSSPGWDQSMCVCVFMCEVFVLARAMMREARLECWLKEVFLQSWVNPWIINSKKEKELKQVEFPD